MQMYVDNFNLR